MKRQDRSHLLAPGPCWRAAWLSYMAGSSLGNAIHHMHHRLDNCIHKSIKYPKTSFDEALCSIVSKQRVRVLRDWWGDVERGAGHRCDRGGGALVPKLSNKSYVEVAS